MANADGTPSPSVPFEGMPPDELKPVLAQLRGDERRRAVDVGEAPVECQAQQDVHEVRGGAEPAQADVVRDVLGLDVERRDGGHAEPPRDPLRGPPQWPGLVDVDDVGALDRRRQHLAGGPRENRVLTAREPARHRYHELGNPEHVGARRPARGHPACVATFLASRTE